MGYLTFSLPAAQPATVVLHNELGRVVRTLMLPAGAGLNQQPLPVTTDAGQPLAAGTYLLELRAGTFRAQQRLVVLP